MRRKVKKLIRGEEMIFDLLGDEPTFIDGVSFVKVCSKEYFGQHWDLIMGGFINEDYEEAFPFEEDGLLAFDERNFDCITLDCGFVLKQYGSYTSNSIDINNKCRLVKIVDGQPVISDVIGYDVVETTKPNIVICLIADADGKTYMRLYDAEKGDYISIKHDKILESDKCSRGFFVRDSIVDDEEKEVLETLFYKINEEDRVMCDAFCSSTLDAYRVYLMEPASEMLERYTDSFKFALKSAEEKVYKYIPKNIFNDLKS